MSNSLRSHESQHARPPCPSPTPGIQTYNKVLHIQRPGGGCGNPLQYSHLENPHGQRSLVDYTQSMGLQRVRHDWATKHIFKEGVGRGKRTLAPQGWPEPSDAPGGRLHPGLPCGSPSNSVLQCPRLPILSRVTEIPLSPNYLLSTLTLLFS